MCPACAKREMSDTLFDVLSAIRQGVRDVNDKINIILYDVAERIKIKLEIVTHNRDLRQFLFTLILYSITE